MQRNYFLKPQRPVEDIYQALKLIPEYESQQNHFEPLSVNPLFDNPQANDLLQKIREGNDIYSAAELPSDYAYTGYTWAQDEDLITVQLHTSFPISLSDVEINNKEIDSNQISGTFYGEVKNFDMKISNGSLIIQLQVTEKWKILISGGRLDTNSAFFLSVAAKNYQMDDLYERLLIYSASRSNQLALSTLIFHYSNPPSPYKFYWLVQYACCFHDIFSLLALSEILIQQNALFLAETILIQLATQGFEVAFLYLGDLYLTPHENSDFKSDDSTAIQYYEVAAYQLHNLKAMETLGKCYLNGIGVEKDIKKGKALLQQAGNMATDQFLQQYSNENPNQSALPDESKSPEKTKNKEKSNLKDLIIDSAIAIGAVAVGGFLISRLLRKNSDE